MPPTPGSTAPASLAAVASALDATEQALRDGQADVLPGLTETLARALQDCQRQFSPERLETLDGETRLALASIGARLTTLRDLLMRQAGSVNRSLAALFPAEAANAYSRLGQGPGATVAPPRVSNHTSLKA
jgi:hypothetical protein